MYLAHFGLNEPPFKITPNTDFFFTGSNRGAVHDALLYTITHGEGIIKVVGEVGSGKTMLCRMLQTTLPSEIESIYLANPSVAPEDVLFAIAFELQLKLPKNADRLTVLQSLQAYLLKQHADGRQVVIFIEEAQGMPLATLEEIRLLSNLETKQDKLLQIVLFGQPELDENLNETHIRQLRERITHSFRLAPMHKQDIHEYLMFRLRAAGYRGPHLFSDGAIRAIASAAQGLVRRVNIIADKALLAAFADNVHQVTPKHVKAAVKDTAFGEHAFSMQRPRLKFVGFLALLTIALLLGVIFTNANHGKIAGFFTRSYQSDFNSASLVNAANKARVPTDDQSGLPQSTTSPAPLPIRQAARAFNSSEVNDARVQQKAVLQAQVAEQVPNKARAPTIEEVRLQRTQEWLLKQPSHFLSLQIDSILKSEALADALHSLSQLVDMKHVYLYQKYYGNVQHTIVLYGVYESRVDALQALDQLPPSIQIKQPYFRTIGGIHKDLAVDRGR